MVGATIYAGTISNAFKLAIEAGNDIILSSRTAQLNEALWYRNLNLMATDEQFKARIKDAAYRVIKAKLEYYKSGTEIAPLYPDPQKIDEFIPDPDGTAFFTEQACRSITVEKQGMLPLNKETCGRILVMGTLTSFFEDALLRFPQAGQVHYTYDTGPNETQWVIDQLPSITANYKTIIICVSNENHVKIANYFKDSGKNVIILSTMSPELTKSLSWCNSILLGYSWRCEYSFKAMLAVVNGEFVPEGIKPYN
jgi:beta-N-acetylhexosaminidase